MSNRRPERGRTTARRFVAGAILAAAIFGSGCKTTGSSSGGTGSTHSDPIFGRNIPKQDIPIPGSDGYGADNRDPLLRNMQASRDGNRYDKEPFRPNAGTTPAALAAKNGDGQASVPSIDDRPTGTPTSRNPVPFKPSADATGTIEQAQDELRRIGVKWNAPRRGSNGESIFECDVPMGPNGEGPFRRYEGFGASDAAAAWDAVKQIKSEPRR
ncbi:MAG TPA: hypothetical protein VGJ05_13920 [Fimbriiglobus sp.]|jgi:hypothetical protein